MEVKTLTAPPIKEVIFDIRVNQLGIGSDQILKYFDDQYLSIQEQFPEKHALYQFETKFDLSSPKNLSVDNQLDGYHCLSRDKQKIVQFRKNGFTFNQLSPYPGWDTFIQEAEQNWKIYSGGLSGIVTRLAIRTINELVLPSKIANIDEFLNLKINIPATPNLLPENYNIRSSFKYEDFKVIISLVTLMPTPDPINTKVLLDIDLIFEHPAEGYSLDSQEIIQVFNKMHDIKNLLFFDCLTEKGGEVLI